MSHLAIILALADVAAVLGFLAVECAGRFRDTP
jgi:hypothetical protein